jgi:threonylcarbamoyladenosine tRNA methylthiotransferase MtaB
LSIWADFIVWFPWEDENDFNDSIDIIKRFQISKIHAFPFSAHGNRDMIPAAKLRDQIKEHIKSSRMRQMLKIWNEIREDFLKGNSGNKLRLLAEKISWSNFSGWSENYIFLNENNFKPQKKDSIKRWNVITGIFTYNPIVKDTDADWWF